MRPPDETDQAQWIVLFDSIHDVLAAERVFQEREVWCDLVPIPRDLSASCGMAIAFRQRESAAVRAVLADPRVKARGVYPR